MPCPSWSDCWQADLRAYAPTSVRVGVVRPSRRQSFPSDPLPESTARALCDPIERAPATLPRRLACSICHSWCDRRRLRSLARWNATGIATEAPHRAPCGPSFPSLTLGRISSRTTHHDGRARPPPRLEGPFGWHPARHADRPIVQQPPWPHAVVPTGNVLNLESFYRFERPSSRRHRSNPRPQTTCPCRRQLAQKAARFQSVARLEPLDLQSKRRLEAISTA